MYEEREDRDQNPIVSPEIVPLMYQKSSLGLLNFQWAALKSNSEKQQQLLVFLKLVYYHERCEDSQFHQDLSLFWDDLANSS